MMRLLIFLVYSNIWIGMGAAAITLQYYWVEHLPINWFIVALSFFATVLTYTFQRYVKILNNTRNRGDRMDWMEKNDLLIKTIMLLSTAGCIYTLYHFKIESLWLLAIIGALSLFYVIKLPGKFGKNLRDIPSLKIFLIAFVWAVIGSFLPYFNLTEKVATAPWFLFAANFLFVLAITIPFDIRDLYLDEDEKRTIPQILGAKKARYLGMLLLAVNGTLFMSLTAYTYDIFFAMAIFTGLLLIWKSKPDSNDLYYSFVMDGLLILQPLCVLADLYYFEL